MSPEEQIDVMLQQEMEIESQETKPTESDLEVHSYCLPSLNLLSITLGISVILNWRKTAESPREFFKNTEAQTP